MGLEIDDLVEVGAAPGGSPVVPACASRWASCTAASTRRSPRRWRRWARPTACSSWARCRSACRTTRASSARSARAPCTPRRNAIHRGRTTWLWDIEMRDDDGKLCATSRVTIAVTTRSHERSDRMKPTYGFFSFTEVTDPAEHRSYNEWHQLDHLPEQFPLAGHRLRAAVGVDAGVPRGPRRERTGARPDPLRHLYLMAEPIEQTLDDFFALGAELHRLDRFHRHRRAHLTGPVRASTAPRPRPACSCRPRRVPFRAHRGHLRRGRGAARGRRRRADAAPR